MTLQYYELMVQINSGSFSNGSYNVMLDTFNTDDNQLQISFNYQIDDINDITTTNNSFSQQIALPDTKVNRTNLEYIFSINADSTFDPTKKSKCWLMKNTVVVFEGYMQLIEIDYDYNTYQNMYQVVIYADNANLFTNIGTKLLTDLNLKQYDHTYNAGNVTASWYNPNYTNGYVYPFIDYSGEIDEDLLGELNLTYFKPGMYLKTVFDEIFLEAGYSYTSTFLNSYPFTQMFMPFNNTSLTKVSNIPLFYDNGDHVFIAGLTTSGISWIGPGLTGTGGTVSIHLPATYPSQGFSDFNYNIDYYDPNGFYSTADAWYKGPTPSVPFSQKFGADLNIVWTTNIDWYTVSGGPYPFANNGVPLDDIFIVCRRSMNNYGGIVPDWPPAGPPTLDDVLYTWVGSANNIITIGGLPYYSVKNNASFYLDIDHSGPPVAWWGTFVSFVTDPLNNTDPTGNMQPLRPGEEVKFFFYRILNDGTGGVFLPQAQDVIIVNNSLINPTQPQSRIYSIVDPNTIIGGMGISASNILPANIKQIDLLSTVTKMFNLKIEPDKLKANNMRIEPTDDYYTKYQVIKDWTNKLDIGQPITSQVVSNTQLRRNIFSYTADKDYWNTIYTANTNQIYGQYEFDINNDFITDENDVTSLFSPTPIDQLSGSNYTFLPTIINNAFNGVPQAFSGMNPRLLIFNTLPLIGSDQFIFNGVNYSFYPYCGPVNDPLNPKVSLNFGQVPALYTGFNDTVNNLFYNYWQETMTQLSDPTNRIVTAYFYLDSNDISQFYFSDLIHCRIDNMEGYYHVNRIINFDPSSQTSTQVELIKAYNYNIT